MTHVNLVNLRAAAGGIRIPSMVLTIRDVTYTIPALAYQVSGSVVVFPRLEKDEEANSFRVRLDCWGVACDGDPWREVPLDCRDMGIAVRAAMQFMSDPGIGWDSSDEDLRAWAAAFVEEQAGSGGDR